MMADRVILSCSFLGCTVQTEASSLCHARRSMRTHCLRYHGASYSGEGVPPRLLSPEELARELEGLRRRQRNSRERRRDRGREVSVRAASGAGPGLAAGSGLPGADTGVFFPDLSAAQMLVTEDWDSFDAAPLLPIVAESGVQTDPVLPPPTVFELPAGMTESEMVDLLVLHPGRRPSSLVDLLASRPGAATTAARADEIRYWLTVLTSHLRLMAVSLRDDLLGELARDPSGRSAFNLGFDRLTQWARRPLD